MMIDSQKDERCRRQYPRIGSKINKNNCGSGFRSVGRVDASDYIILLLHFAKEAFVHLTTQQRKPPM